MKSPPKSSRWQRFAQRLILACCGIGIAPWVHAQMIGYEGFEAYAGGVQVETGTNGTSGTGLDGGSGWGGPYDVQNGIKSLVFIDDRTVNPVIYQNGAIVLNGGVRALRLSATANGSYAIRRPLAAALAAGGTVYFSFLFRTANSSPLANQDFLQVGFDNNPNPASGTPRVSVGTNTISTTFPPNQPFRFFARSSAATASSMFDNTTDIQGSTTYLLVGKISRTGGGNFDRVDLFVNPSTLSEPVEASASVTVDSGISTLSHFFVRTVNLDSNDANVIDELRVGLSFGSVVSDDGDSDGMPDRWEEAHGFDPLSAADATLDADSDGQSNRVEYRAGTDPRDATSLFSITSVTSDLNGLILEWRSGPGRRYHVQWSDDLVTWNVLNDGGVPVVLDASSGSRTSFAFVPTTTAERRFYRIEALP